METVTAFLSANWGWLCAVIFYAVEKYVRFSKSERDDILFDMVLKPIYNAFFVKKTS